MKQMIVILLVCLALAVTWFLASPLFIDKTVDERFDLLGQDGSLDMQAVMTMDEGKRAEMMTEIMDAAARAPDQTLVEAMPNNSPVLLARGEFTDADVIHKGSGQALLYELPDGRQLVRLEDFRTTNGPALVVYLARHPMPASAGDVSDNGFLSLGKLKGNIGNQNYVVPAGTVVADYHSVVIWCELFGVLFSPAALQPTG